MGLRTYSAALISAVMVWLVPALSDAQTTPPQDALHATIMTSLLADPRSANIPPVQLKALVDTLASQAAAQNISAADIMWKPQVAQTFAAGTQAREVQCDGWLGGYACALNEVFGFAGSSYVIPISLLAILVFLIAATYELILHHRKKLRIVAPGAMPWDNMPK